MPKRSQHRQGQEGGPGMEATRQRIIEAAHRVFAEKGYARATTRAIAALAGVNEVTIFRHFGSKKNLVMASVERYSALPGLEEMVAGRLTGDYRRDLFELGLHFLRMLNEHQRSIRRMLCESDDLPELRAVMAEIPRRLRAILARYLHRRMEEGAVKQADPEMAAQAFLGMIFSYSLNLALLSPEERARMPAPEAAVAAFVEIFAAGTAVQ